MPRVKHVTVLEEYFDHEKLEAIIKSHCEMLNTEDSNNRLKAAPQLYQTYLDASKPVAGTNLHKVKIKYFHTEGCPGKGRLYAKLVKGNNKYSIGFQNMCKTVRHTIASEVYHDLDFSNCHPELLRQLCKQNQISCPMLVEYCADREGILKSIGGKDPKLDIIRCLYGGGDNSHPFLANLKTEMLNIQIWLWETYPEFQKLVKKSDNKGGSCCSYICQDIENKCLTALREFLEKQGYEIGALVFDGIQARKDTLRPITQELLDKAADYVEEKTGFRLALVEKPMDQGLTLDLSDISTTVSPTTVETMKDVGFDTAKLTWENPETFQCSVVECPLCKSSHKNATFTIGDGVLSCNQCDCTESMEMDDRKAARRLVRQSAAKGFKVLSCEKQVYVYAPKTGIYEPCSKTQGFRNLRLALNGCWGMGKYAGSTSDQMRMFAQVLDIAEEETDLWNKSALTSKGKLHFRDCIYDFYTGETCEFTPEIVAMHKLPVVYPSHVTEEQVQYVRKNFYEPIFDEKTTYFLQTLARGLAGHIEDKQFVVGTGEGNNGKSVMRESLLNALPNYSTGFDYKDMVFNKNASDTGRANKLSFQLRGTRLAFSSECAQQAKISATILKTITGGDKTIGRDLYVSDVQITPSCTPMMFGNSMIQVDAFDKAVANRLVNVEFNTTFVKGREPAPNTNERKADDAICDHMKSEAGESAHIRLLLQSYSATPPLPPKSVMEASEEVKGFEYEDEEGVLKELFDFVPHETTSAVKCYNVVKYRGLVWGKSKIGRQMKKLGAVYNRHTASYEHVKVRATHDMDF